MATVIGDFASDPSLFHRNMVFPQPKQSQQQQQQQQHQSLCSSSRSRGTPSSRPYHNPQPPSSSIPQLSTPSTSSSSPSSSSLRQHSYNHQRPAQPKEHPRIDWTKSAAGHQEDGVSRFPTPPDSSSPSVSNSADARPQHAGGNSPVYMFDTAERSAADAAHSRHCHSDHCQPSSDPPSAAASDATVVPPFSFSSSSTAHAQASVSAPTSAYVSSRPPIESIPSPPSEGFRQWAAVPGSPSHSPHMDTPTQQTTIHIRDLAHIQSLAREDLVTGNGPGILNDPPLSQMKYEISGMPIGDIIEMVAALLTKITTTNDLQHDALNRNAAHQRQAQLAQRANEAGEGSSSGGGGGSPTGGKSGNSHSSPFANSVLAFHGKNVPAITILSYLSRIHKYCPTTFEVFLSLLVYFDRMTERVNEIVMKSEQERQVKQQQQQSRPGDGAGEDIVMSDDVGGGHESDETDEDLADSTDGENGHSNQERKIRGGKSATKDFGSALGTASAAPAASAMGTATYFVVDSFNIHRLIIAGVTCASKFFSDVFYTNSRYAKVGGLPLAELNHLELQFLLLNDFRLAVPVEDLEAYATMLVEFYAREVVAQRSRPAAGSE